MASEAVEGDVSLVALPNRIRTSWAYGSKETVDHLLPPCRKYEGMAAKRKFVPPTRILEEVHGESWKQEIVFRLANGRFWIG